MVYGRQLLQRSGVNAIRSQAFTKSVLGTERKGEMSGSGPGHDPTKNNFATRTQSSTESAWRGGEGTG